MAEGRALSMLTSGASAALPASSHAATLAASPSPHVTDPVLLEDALRLFASALLDGSEGELARQENVESSPSSSSSSSAAAALGSPATGAGSSGGANSHAAPSLASAVEEAKRSAMLLAAQEEQSAARNGRVGDDDDDAVLFGNQSPTATAATALCQAAEALRYAEIKRNQLLQEVKNASAAMLSALNEPALAAEAVAGEAMAENDRIRALRSDHEKVSMRLRDLMEIAERQKSRLESGKKGDNFVSLVEVAELRERERNLDDEIRKLEQGQRERRRARSEARGNTPVTFSAVACGGSAEMLQAVVDFFNSRATSGLGSDIERFRGFASAHGPSTDDAAIASDPGVAAFGAALLEDNSDEEDDNCQLDAAGQEASGAVRADDSLCAVVVSRVRQLSQDAEREKCQLQVIVEKYQRPILADPTLFSHMTKDDADAIFSNLPLLHSSLEKWAPQLRSAADSFEAELSRTENASENLEAAIEPVLVVSTTMLTSLPAVLATYVANYSQQMIALHRCVESSPKLRAVLAQAHASHIEETPLDLVTLLTMPLNYISKIKLHLDALRREFAAAGGPPLSKLDFCVEQVSELAQVVEQGLLQYQVEEIRSRVAWPRAEEVAAEMKREREKAENPLKWDDKLEYAEMVREMFSSDAWATRSLASDSVCKYVAIQDAGDAERIARSIKKLSTFPVAREAGFFTLLPPPHRGRVLLFSDCLMLVTSKAGANEDRSEGQFVFLISLRHVRRVESMRSKGPQGLKNALRVCVALSPPPGETQDKFSEPPVVAFVLEMASVHDRRELSKSIGITVRKLTSQNLFGVSLRTLMEGPDNAGGGNRAEVDVPAFVEAVIQHFELTPGLLSEVGLFRLSPRSKDLTEMQDALNVIYEKETGKGSIVMTMAIHDRLRTRARELFAGRDVHAVAGLLKLWLRMMPAPLMTFKLYDDWIQLGRSIQSSASESALSSSFLSLVDTGEFKEHVSTARKLLSRMPRYNRCTLQELCKFLRAVRDNEGRNKMTTNNLAIVFAPPLLRQHVETRRERATSVAGGSFVRAAMMDLAAQQTAFNVIMLLIDSYDSVFSSIISDRQKRKGEQRAAKQITMRAKRTQRVMGAGAFSSNAGEPSASAATSAGDTNSARSGVVVIADDSTDDVGEDVDRGRVSGKRSGVGADILRPESVLSLRLEDIVRQGYLEKKGGSRHNWKKRWFVLKKRFLYYFSSPSNETPKGVINLTNARSQPRTLRGQKRPWLISVLTDDREFLMSAESESEAEEWVRSIKQASVAEYYDVTGSLDPTPEPPVPVAAPPNRPTGGKLKPEKKSTLRGLLTKRG